MRLDGCGTWNTDKSNGDLSKVEQEYDKVLLLSASERSELEMLLDELAELIEFERGVLIP
jgi:hypothetical protein